MTLSAETAHDNMVWRQVRPNEVSDERVLTALQAVERAAFVAPELAALAYADTQLPIGEGQHLLSPLQEARILQGLALNGDETVLEIGTGSGYFTALLAQLAAQVLTVEYFASLSDAARQRHQQLGLTNIRHEIGDASQGWDLPDRVDVIVITAAFTELPESYLNQIKVGGRLLAIIGTAPAMSVQLIQRVAETDWQTEILFETVVAPMIHAEPKATFTF